MGYLLVPIYVYKMKLVVGTVINYSVKMTVPIKICTSVSKIRPVNGFHQLEGVGGYVQK